MQLHLQPVLFTLILTLSIRTFAQQPEDVSDMNPVTIREDIAQETAVPSPDSSEISSAVPPLKALQNIVGTDTSMYPSLAPLLRTLKLNYSEGALTAADRAAGQMLAIQPSDYDAVKYKGMIALRQNRLSDADTLFNLAKTAEGRDAELDYHVGLLRLLQNRPFDAEREFRKYSDYGLLEPYRERMEKAARHSVPSANRDWAKRAAALETAQHRIRPGSVAVLPFFNSGAPPELEPLSRALAEMISTDLAQTGRITVLERSQVHALAMEIGLSQAGLTMEPLAGKAGLLLGSEHVVTGRFSGGKSGNLEISANIISSISGSVKTAGDVSGTQKSFFRLQKELVFGIIGELGVILTDDERKKVETVPTENVLALLAYGKGLSAEDNGDFSKAKAAYAEASRLDPRFTPAREALNRVSDLDGYAPSAQPVTIGQKPQAQPLPVFTIGGFAFSSGGTASCNAHTAATSAFMPEQRVSASPLTRTMTSRTPSSQEPAPVSTGSRNAYVDAYNIGLAGGTVIVKVKVPVPQE